MGTPMKHSNRPTGRKRSALAAMWNGFKHTMKGAWMKAIGAWTLGLAILYAGSFVLNQQGTNIVTAGPAEHWQDTTPVEEPIVEEPKSALWWEDIRDKQNDYEKPITKPSKSKEKKAKEKATVANRFGFWVEGKSWLSKEEYKGEHLKTKEEKKAWKAAAAKWQAYCLSDKSSFVAAAKSLDRENGVPAAISLAQFIIEGGWGTSRYAGQHNYHAMKGGGTGEGRVKSSNSYMAFKSLWFGFFYYSKNINTNYAGNRTGDSTKEWAECLCSHSNGIGKYDVGPECALEGDKAYDVQLQKIVSQYKLERFNKNGN